MFFAALAPMLFLPLRLTARLSVLGLLAVVTTFIAGLVAPALGGSRREDQCVASDLGLAEGASTRPEWWVPQGMGVALPVFLYAYGGHCVFPDLLNEMPKAERAGFPRAVNRGFGGATIVRFI